MKKLLKKRVKSIAVVVALFIIINVALSFAYIRGGSLDSESVSTVALTGGSVNVKYSSNSGAIIANNIVPGYETTKQFTITSEFGKGHEYYDLGLWYQINLVVDKNEFGDGSLTYSLSLDKASDVDGVPATNVEYVGIPSGQNLQGISVGAGRLMNDNKSHIYNLKITYAETLTDQSEEIGCKFEAHITLTNPKIVKIILDLDGGEISVPGYDAASKSLTSATNSLYTLPIPEKSGYSFNGWEVVSRNATLDGNILSVKEENVTLKANYRIPYFSQNSWSVIAANVQAGHADMYAVGDEKEVTIDGTNYTVRVANNSTPSECNTEGFSQTACGFVVEFVDIFITLPMNPTATNVGGWPATLMRKSAGNENEREFTFVDTEGTSHTYPTFFSLLPIELQNVIIDTTVVSGHGASDSTNFISIDKIYMLSVSEIVKDDEISVVDTASTSTRLLDYYENLGVTIDNYSGLIKKFNGTATTWWLRTALPSSSRSFLGSSTDIADGIYFHADISYGVAPAFRIG